MEKLENKLSNNKIVLFLISAIFFTLPFERIPTFEIGGFTIKLSYLAAIIFLIVALFSNILPVLKIRPLSLSDWFLVAFWFFSLLSSLATSPDVKRSIIILSLWLFVFLLYFYLSRILIDNKIRARIFQVILCSSVLVCLFGLFQFIGDSISLGANLTGLRIEYTKVIMGFPRIQSVALEPLYFANFLLVPFFISIVKYVQNKKLFHLYFWISILILTNIILTISRGAYIAIGVSLLIFIVYLFINRYKDNYMNKLIGIVIILLISLSISFGLIKKLNGRQAVSNFTEHSVVNNVQADGSAFDRIGTYKVALNNFKREPILGTGAGSFGVLTKTASGKSGYGIVNNEYIEILSENGLVGFILFFSFLIALLLESIHRFKKVKDYERLMLTGLFLGIFAILIQYNFFSTLYIIYIWAFLALLKSYTYQIADNQNS